MTTFVANKALIAFCCHSEINVLLLDSKNLRSAVVNHQITHLTVITFISNCRTTSTYEYHPIAIISSHRRKHSRFNSGWNLYQLPAMTIFSKLLNWCERFVPIWAENNIDAALDSAWAMLVPLEGQVGEITGRWPQLGRKIEDRYLIRPVPTTKVYQPLLSIVRQCRIIAHLGTIFNCRINLTIHRCL